MNYILHICVMVFLYIILGLSLNLLIGYTGLLSVCQAAFYSIGAYTTTLLMVKLGFNFFVALICGIIIAMLLSFAVSIPSLRLKRDYLILGTLGFQNIIYGILYNWVPLTRGPYGISGIPSASILGLEINSIFGNFLLGGVLAILSIFIIWRIVNSPFGLVLKGIREDEIATLGLGKNVSKFKIMSFLITAGIASVAGGIYAVYVSFIDPTSFTIYESIFIISIVLVGGSGNIKGPMVGAVLLVIIPEILRFLRIPDVFAANVRQMIYGLLLIILMRFRPQGIAGEYKFE